MNNYDEPFLSAVVTVLFVTGILAIIPWLIITFRNAKTRDFLLSVLEEMHNGGHQLIDETTVENKDMVDIVDKYLDARFEIFDKKLSYSRVMWQFWKPFKLESWLNEREIRIIKLSSIKELKQLE